MKKIRACLNCGSKNISWKSDSIAGTVYFGSVGGRVQCGKCGYEGTPIEFESEKEYGKFLEGLKRRKEMKGAHGKRGSF